MLNEDNEYLDMRKVIYVLSHGNQWKVQCEHCGDKIMNTQTEAIKAAKSHVAALPRGTLSHVDNTCLLSRAVQLP